MIHEVTCRSPAVAGMFYPDNPATLRQQIRGFLEEGRSRAAAEATPAPVPPPPKAIVVPHAGTVYSGPVAGTVYARLESRAAALERVVLLGPSHRVPLQGLAASSHESFATPLGDIPLDPDSIARLVELPQVTINDEAHRREHSLEVNLPFLQEALGDFTLVPLVVGQASAQDVAEVLEAAWGGPETLIVISTDLSHFLDYDTAQALDRETSSFIEQLAFERISDERACGRVPLRGMLLASRNRGLSVQCVDLRSSGDTAGTRREVVGYGSYIVG